VWVSDCFRGPYGGFRVCPGSGDVAHLQGNHAGIVVQGLLGTGEGSAYSGPAAATLTAVAYASRLMPAARRRRAGGQLDLLDAQRPRSVRLASEVIRRAQHCARQDEQPVVAGPAGDLAAFSAAGGL